ncbi:MULTISPECIES: YcaO-like family protein [Rhizobium]|uniref:YcaO-like family protein n=1 Tax=Rhizobium leguminosarum TaxID=384 RepID=A0A2Z4YQ64_RHILE|nr:MULTISPECIES: YcaO-like family protein [Rhizobium]AXA43540.1 YcaO-like family protein [Rhizobium leguminosarum]MBA9036757.1 ribosomal protein S12 methylthiotransferase accessory factor [Rhizobium leguminosarum]
MTENMGTSIRNVSASYTLAAIQPLLERYDISGFVDHSPKGAETLKSIEVVRINPRSGHLNLGKGFSFETALASGYMEAIEMSTVEGAPEIALHALPQSAFLYTGGGKPPEPNAARMIRGVELLSREPVYSPVYEHFLSPGASAQPISVNGLASGNAVDEASLHGLYELIERDLTARSLRDPAQVRQLLLNNNPEPIFKALAELELFGLSVEFYLLGQFLGVTVLQCALVKTGSEGGEVYYGWGAHHFRAIAASRAMTEAVQAWCTREACRAQTLPLSRMLGGIMVSAEVLKLLREPVTQGERQLRRRFVAGPSVAYSLAEQDEQAPASPTAALSQLLSSARDAGIRHVFAWTLSPPDRPFAVVKCVIPGFETPFEVPS